MISVAANNIVCVVHDAVNRKWLKRHEAQSSRDAPLSSSFPLAFRFIRRHPPFPAGRLACVSANFRVLRSVVYAKAERSHRAI